MWIQVRVPSELVSNAIVEHKDALPEHERTLLAGHIEMTAKRMRRIRHLPVSWAEQRRILGFD